jgi:hypothetical protein
MVVLVIAAANAPLHAFVVDFYSTNPSTPIIVSGSEMTAPFQYDQLVTNAKFLADPSLDRNKYVSSLRIAYTDSSYWWWIYANDTQLGILPGTGIPRVQEFFLPVSVQNQLLDSIAITGNADLKILLYATNIQTSFPITQSRLRFAYNEQPIPEPATMMLLGTGIASLLATRVRKHTRTPEKHCSVIRQ